MLEIAAFAVLLFIAEVLGTLGGFGSSMLVMPIATRFLPFEQALGLTAVFHVFSNASKIILFRKGMDRRLLLRMGAPAVAGVLAGAILAARVDTDALAIALGLTLLALSTMLFLLPRIRIAPTARNAIGGGLLSGFIAGLVGTGGAVRGITLAAFGLEKQVFIATSAWIDMGVDLSRSAVYWSQGFVDPRLWRYLPVLAVVSWAGSWMGRRILEHIDQALFEKLVLVLVFVVGLYSVLRTLCTPA